MTGIDLYIGKWVSTTGQTLDIVKVSTLKAKVTFYNIFGENPKRPYYENKPTIKMPAYYDEDEGDLNVELWEKDKEFELNLLHELDYIIDDKNRESLVPGLTRFVEDDFLDQYYKLFGLQEHYCRATPKKQA